MGTPQRWLVCAALAGGRPLQLAAAARREESRGLVPWVGAAAPLPPLPAASAARGASEAAAAAAAAVAAGQLAQKDGDAISSAAGADGGSRQPGGGGLAFVFLPLPIATGLPVHVNGCFELSRHAPSAS